jgi:hypothetical protein
MRSLPKSGKPGETHLDPARLDPAIARKRHRQRLAFGIALEDEAARSRRVEREGRGCEFACAETRRSH